MNLFSQNFNRLRQRTAITLVEVLTSITVAVIGVAGVLILIPFATRQANVGLDREAATTIAENSVARFQIEGFSRVATLNGEKFLPWVIPRQPNTARTLGIQNARGEELADVPLVSTASDRSIFFIDPLWLNAHLRGINIFSDAEQNEFYTSMFRYVGRDPVFTTQPFESFNPEFAIDTFLNGIVLRPDPNNRLVIPPFLPTYVHLLDTSSPFDLSFVPQQMTQAIATRMFVSTDELQFSTEIDTLGNEIDDLSPPSPYLDQDLARLTDGIDSDFDGTVDESDEAFLRRQYQGGISWSAVAVSRRPIGADLFANPPTGLSADGFDFHVVVYRDRSFSSPVEYSLNPTLPADADPRFLVAPLIVDVPVSPAGEAPAPVTIRANGDSIVLNAPDISIRNDDWLMLINYDTLGIAQVGFFRVIGSTPRRGPSGNMEAPRILIDGPEFTLYDENEDLLPNRTATYAVYLPDVINVYKRQLTPDEFE